MGKLRVLSEVAIPADKGLQLGVEIMIKNSAKAKMIKTERDVNYTVTKATFLMSFKQIDSQNACTSSGHNKIYALVETFFVS